MRYEIKVVEGCTAFGIYVNGEDYTDEMTDRERDLFVLDVLIEIRRLFDEKSIGITDLLSLLHEHGFERSKEPCETCGDYITEITYQIK